ncbi:hypothetical protein CAPTEDRAFT_229033 [Capitella teleta]|uniref:tRNA-splicing endonuclease subunit Sen54 N-terminal domain-containing protein n=1 Tax=Capitella teleta TaxID=283909 RepID=R7TJ78_CAPTE|nr:hypothetical protein CAPTEDRAFT_229033 [Capitella teleta]|eukprot:ELT91160.1 hypothetical protein CAPTEDRAFT_229033 [Capitella teleta]
MAARYLRAEELGSNIAKFCSPDLPQGSGLKSDEPDGSWLQAKQIDHYHRERKELLNEERVQVSKTLTKAQWDPVAQKVEVISKAMHQFWKVMGHVEEGRFWLQPEEALFLMDEGVVEIYHGEVPLSLQQAYGMFLNCSTLPPERYQVYSHLCRLGYIVRRHVPACGLRMTTAPKVDDEQMKEESSESTSQIKRKLSESDVDTKRIKESTTEECVVDQTAKLSVADAWSPVPKDQRVCKKSHSWNFAEINFPDLSVVEDKVMTLPSLPSDLLPSGISRDEPTKYRPNRYKQPAEADASDQMEFSCDAFNTSPVENASNWQEWKTQSRHKCNNALVDLVHNGKTKPLVDSVVGDSHQVLSRLQIFKPLILPEKSEDACTPSSPVSPVFDVHLPNANFKKTNPGTPDLRVCVYRQSEMVPDLSQIVKLSELYEDNVLLQWAVVDNGDVAFYSFNQIDLPVDLTD